MAGRILVRLVDWDAMVADFRNLRNPSDYERLLAGAPWRIVERDGGACSPLSDLTRGCSKFYDTLREELPSALRLLCDEFLGAFFWGEPSGRLRELIAEARVAPELFQIAVSPPTIRAYLKLFMTIPLEELRGPFDRARARLTTLADAPSQPVSFDAFCDYLWSWVDLMQDAASKNAGLVVSIHSN